MGRTATKVWVVRIIQRYEYETALDKILENPMPESWVECLVHAGMADRVETGEDNHLVFDLLPPAGVTNTRAWAEAEAGRIKSFGMNAAAAPRAK